MVTIFFDTGFGASFDALHFQIRCLTLGFGANACIIRSRCHHHHLSGIKDTLVSTPLSVLELCYKRFKEVNELVLHVTTPGATISNHCHTSFLSFLEGPLLELISCIITENHLFFV
jgi:hypothetical protein